MAANLGTLTLDLIAKISGFVGPLDKATTATKKQTAEMKKAFDDWAKGIGAAVGAAAAAIPAVTTALVTQTALAAKEIVNLSNLTGLTTTEFQKYAAAAATVGIEQQKLADIFKDTNDKVGDFLATGGGELQNFFETIAPKVGVTAEQFRKLNSADALQLYVSSLQKANVNQAQMTFFMEAIADEATALVPLLADGGAKFKELGDAALATGMILDDTTIASAKEFNNQLTVLGQYATAAKTALAAEFMPVLAQLAKDLADTSKEAGGLQVQIKELANGMVEVAAMTASTIDGVARGFKVTAAALVGTFSTAIGYLQKLGAGANQILNFLSWGDTAQEFRDTAKSFASDAGISFDIARLAMVDLKAEFEKPLAGDALRDYVKQAKAAAAELPKILPATTGLPGFTPTGRPAPAGKPVVDKAAQKEELERQKELKKVEEERLKLLAFTSSLERENQTARAGFQSELAGQGQGDKLRERLQADLAIQEEFNEKFNALRDQRVSGDISQDLFEKETALLEEALGERIVLQQDYYNQLDELQGDWILGVQEAWANFADTATNFNQQAADATASILGEATSGVQTFLTSIIDGTASAGDAFRQLGISMATSVIDALTQMAAQWIVYQGVQMALGTASTAASVTQAAVAGPAIAAAYAPAAAAASIASFGTAPVAGLSSLSAVVPAAIGLFGMAHDGIDSVPQDGSWFLQKGERVTTAQTSAKLDSTLESIRQGDAERGQSAPNVNIYEDANKAGQSKQNPDGSIDVWIANFMGEGETYDAVSSKMGWKAVGR